MAKPIALFCDFDGTITERDMIVTICEKFCPPDIGRGSPPVGPPGWETIKEQVLTRKKTVREGVAELFAMIPSSQKDAMIQYAHDVVQIRDGFQEFLKFCKDNGLLLIVCSGGVDFFVEPLMAPYQSWIHKLYSIPSDFSGPTVTLKHPYGCETCGLCKVKVMNEYPDTIKILIGDSVTDLHGAHQANIVLARNGLKDYLDQDKIAYKPFENFYDVVQILNSFQGGKRCAPHIS